MLNCGKLDDMTSGAAMALALNLQEQLRLVARQERWTRGSLIFHPEDTAESIYFLERGSVRLYGLGPGPREVTLAVHMEGEMFGFQAAAGEECYGHYAECMEDASALVLSRAALERLMEEQPEMATALNQQIILRISDLQRRLASLVFQEVSQRLAAALLELADMQTREQGGWTGEQHLLLSERLSHQELAYVVGSTRETITKLLGEFRGRGLLDLGYRRILLLNRAGLQALVLRPMR